MYENEQKEIQEMFEKQLAAISSYFNNQFDIANIELGYFQTARETSSLFGWANSRSRKEKPVVMLNIGWLEILQSINSNKNSLKYFVVLEALEDVIRHEILHHIVSKIDYNDVHGPIFQKYNAKLLIMLPDETWRRLQKWGFAGIIEKSKLVIKQRAMDMV